MIGQPERARRLVPHFKTLGTLMQYVIDIVNSFDAPRRR